MSPTGEVAAPTAPFRVGEWLVEPGCNRVSRGSVSVRIDLKTMELLLFFAEKAGRVVSKKQLIDFVWGGDFVAAGTLTHAIASLRKALGDDAVTEAYIETIPKRGYRLVAPVSFPDTNDQERRKRGPRFRLEACDVGFALVEGENLIGRDENAHVRIDWLGVSRRHARIIVRGSSATLEDMGSTNGTFLRGIRVDAPARLSHGDEICIGHGLAWLRFLSG